MSSSKTCLNYFYLTLLLLATADAEKNCEPGPVDLVLVIDDSGSVGINDFQKALYAAADLSSMFKIGDGSQKARFGLVLFSSRSRVIFDINDYSTKEEVRTALLAASANYTGGGTNIASGMRKAIEVFASPPNYDKRPKKMLIMTDGDDSSDVASARKQAELQGIVVYAIAIGQSVRKEELIEATGNPKRVLSTDNYDTLKLLIPQLCYEIESSVAPSEESQPKSCGCEDEKLLNGVNYWLDIIFVVDSTNVVMEEDFTSIRSFIASFGNIQIGPTAENPKQYTRVGIINTASQAEVIANLSRASNGIELQQIVMNELVQKGGTTFNVQAGLEAARDMLLEESQMKRRMNVPKVVVLFSTIPINCGIQSKAAVKADTNVLCSLATYLREETNLFTIGLKMAGSSEFPYIDIANSCNRLDNTVDMMEKMLRGMCRANCFCKQPYTQFTVADQCEKYAECLFVHQLSLPYKSALNTCYKDGAMMSNILSTEKETFLTNLHITSNFYPFWIGMNKSNASYVWSDGTVHSPNEYENWCAAKQQPSTGDCAYISQCQGFSSAWFTTKCGAMLPAYYFSCQTDACSVEDYCDE